MQSHFASISECILNDSIPFKWKPLCCEHQTLPTLWTMQLVPWSRLNLLWFTCCSPAHFTIRRGQKCFKGVLSLRHIQLESQKEKKRVCNIQLNSNENVLRIFMQYILEIYDINRQALAAFHTHSACAIVFIYKFTGEN